MIAYDLATDTAKFELPKKNQSSLYLLALTFNVISDRKQNTRNAVRLRRIQLASDFFLSATFFFFVLETYGFDATAQNYKPGYQPLAANPPLPRFKPILKPFTNSTSSHNQIYNKAITFAERGDWIKLKGLKHLNKNAHMEKFYYG